MIVGNAICGKTGATIGGGGSPGSSEGTRGARVDIGGIGGERGAVGEVMGFPAWDGYRWSGGGENTAETFEDAGDMVSERAGDTARSNSGGGSVWNVFKAVESASSYGQVAKSIVRTQGRILGRTNLVHNPTDRRLPLCKLLRKPGKLLIPPLLSIPVNTVLVVVVLAIRVLSGNLRHRAARNTSLRFMLLGLLVPNR